MVRGHHGTGDQSKRHDIAAWLFGAIILYFLLAEHRAHVVPFLPWLLLLACPLLHLAMHGRDGNGHVKHGGGRGKPGE